MRINNIIISGRIMALKKIKNRRRGPDAFVKWTGYLAITSLLIIFIIFIIVSIAKPPVEGFFDRQYGISVNSSWDKTLVNYAFYMMFPLMIICGIGLLINSTRLKRKTDTYNKALIISFIISIIGIVYFFIS